MSRSTRLNWLQAVALSTACVASVPAQADEQVNAAAASAVGSLLGSTVGRQMGGETGAMVGATVGGAAGGAAASSRENREKTAIGAAVRMLRSVRCCARGSVWSSSTERECR